MWLLLELDMETGSEGMGRASLSGSTEKACDQYIKWRPNTIAVYLRCIAYNNMYV